MVLDMASESPGEMNQGAFLGKLDNSLAYERVPQVSISKPFWILEQEGPRALFAFSFVNLFKNLSMAGFSLMQTDC